jgi:hypothetical protein
MQEWWEDTGCLDVNVETGSERIQARRIGGCIAACCRNVTRFWLMVGCPADGPLADAVNDQDWVTRTRRIPPRLGARPTEATADDGVFPDVAKIRAPAPCLETQARRLVASEHLAYSRPRVKAARIGLMPGLLADNVWIYQEKD